VQPKNFQFGGGAEGTILHPLVAAGMLLAIVAILFLPRRRAITPFLLAFFTIPLGEVLVLAGIHLQMQQILIVTVLFRMAAFPGVASQKRFAGGFNALDVFVVLWAISAFIIFSLQWMAMQAVIKSLGDLLQTLGGYLAVRFLIPDRAVFRRMLKTFALVCAIQGVLMIIEQFTHQNVLSFLGAPTPEFRDGHVRSQGAIVNLYAGMFAGVSIPLFLWLWTEKKSRIAACTGLIGSTAMVVASFASTSWTTYGASLIGLCFWPFRRQMRLIRCGVVAVLVGLHVVMHGPVWSLIEKIDLTGGSSSYHRYMLVDNCIRHFGDWWFLGARNYGDWGFVMFDVCNQFILVALRGGLLTLILYIWIYKQSFSIIGKTRKRIAGDRAQEWTLWCLGSALFATVVSSFGIYYIVYLIVFFYCLLVSISTWALDSGGVRIEAQPKVQFEWSTSTEATCVPLAEVKGEAWPDLFKA